MELMSIEDFLKQCCHCIVTQKRIEYKNISQKLINELADKKYEIESHDVTKELSIFCRKKWWLNGREAMLDLDMIVTVSPLAPFFFISYYYNVTVLNQLVNKRVWDELYLNVSLSMDCLSALTKEENEIIVILNKYGYGKIDRELELDRVILYPKQESLSSYHWLGGQPYLQRLLRFGVEYDEENTSLLDCTIDESVADVSDDIINLSKYAFYEDGSIKIRDKCRLEHKEALVRLDDLRKKYKGKQFISTLVSLKWHIATVEKTIGDIKIQLNIYIYLSKYIKAYYVQVEKTIIIDNIENKKLVLQDKYMDIDLMILLEAEELYEECNSVLDGLHYSRLTDIKHKVRITNRNGFHYEDVYIGELLFDIPRNAIYQNQV